jgi:hypothetical protein
MTRSTGTCWSQPTANPSFHKRVHKLPFTHFVITDSVAHSEARIACITVPSPDIAEALTIYELARTTQVPVPGYIDNRGERCASTWWMQRRTTRSGRATSSYDNQWYTQPWVPVVPLSFQTLRHTWHAEFMRKTETVHSRWHTYTLCIPLCQYLSRWQSFKCLAPFHMNFHLHFVVHPKRRSATQLSHECQDGKSCILEIVLADVHKCFVNVFTKPSRFAGRYSVQHFLVNHACGIPNQA